MIKLKNKNMDLNDLIIAKNAKVEQMRALVATGEAEKRELNAEENTSFTAIQEEIRGIEAKIIEKNNIKNTITNRTMEENTSFKDLITRNAKGEIENFSARAVTISSGIDSVIVAGNISEVGYEPFYKQMVANGLDIMPGLTTSVKLPFYGAAVTGQKKTEGQRYDNTAVLGTCLLQSARYTVTETISREILNMTDSKAFQAIVAKLMKGTDRAITADIFAVVLAGASAQAGLTGYTNANMDTLVGAVDGDAVLLMPRSEFYRAKGVKLDTYSALFLANKTSNFAGNLWDGTQLFYSQLFTGNTILAVDLQHVTLGEFGSEYLINLDYNTKFAEGQVVVTVAKEAGIVLRNALAAKKAVIA